MKKGIIFILTAAILILQIQMFNVSAMISPLWMGDANQDGNVTIIDAVDTQKYAAGMLELSKRQFYAADVDGDGNVTVRDSTIIQKDCAKMVNLPYVLNHKPDVKNLYADYGSDKACANQEVHFYAEASGGVAPFTYEFYIDGEIVQERSADASLSYTFDKAGVYTVTVFVYNAFDEYVYYSMEYRVAEYEHDMTVPRIRTAYADRLNVCEYDSQVIITAESEGGTAPYEFSFRLDEGALTQQFSADNKFVINQSLPKGVHDVTIVSRDAKGNTATEIFKLNVEEALS